MKGKKETVIRTGISSLSTAFGFHDGRRVPAPVILRLIPAHAMHGRRR